MRLRICCDLWRLVEDVQLSESLVSAGQSIGMRNFPPGIFLACFPTGSEKFLQPAVQSRSFAAVKSTARPRVEARLPFLRLFVANVGIWTRGVGGRPWGIIPWTSGGDRCWHPRPGGIWFPLLKTPTLQATKYRPAAASVSKAESGARFFGHMGNSAHMPARALEGTNSFGSLGHWGVALSKRNGMFQLGIMSALKLEGRQPLQDRQLQVPSLGRSLNREPKTGLCPLVSFSHQATRGPPF